MTVYSSHHVYTYAHILKESSPGCLSPDVSYPGSFPSLFLHLYILENIPFRPLYFLKTEKKLCKDKDHFCFAASFILATSSHLVFFYKASYSVIHDILNSINVTQN